MKPIPEPGEIWITQAPKLHPEVYIICVKLSIYTSRPLVGADVLDNRIVFMRTANKCGQFRMPLYQFHRYYSPRDTT